jgi:hypothetical protein
MGKIYENSLVTLVWLGLDHDSVAIETTDFLKETSKLARDLCEKYGSVTKIPTFSQEENPVSQDPHKWDLFKKFISFRWFTRTWICVFASSNCHLIANNLVVRTSLSRSIQWCEQC